MTALSVAKLPDQLLNIFSIPSAHSFFINGDNIIDKQTFLKEFADQLNFPEYFGFNWDAFSDCITDLSWLEPESSFLIIYKNSHNFRSHSPEEWKVANEILLEAMDYWNQQGKPMMIILL
jgi:RNAse (barnase) inhibitor barstar